MQAKGIDYFENSRRATLAQQQYCIANPGSFTGYGALGWGITASDIQGGYSARGAPPNQGDNGTLVPTAVAGSIAFAPEIVIPTLHNFYDTYPLLWGTYGMRDAFNPGTGWYDTDYLGIDEGPILLMIENYRTGKVWQRVMGNSVIQNGLTRAGFISTVASATRRRGCAVLELAAPSPNPASADFTLRFRLPHAGRRPRGGRRRRGSRGSRACSTPGDRPVTTQVAASGARARFGCLLRPARVRGPGDEPEDRGRPLRPLPFVLVLGCAGLAVAGSSARAGFVERSLHVHGEPQRYVVWEPPGYDRSRAWPLVLALHGSGESGRDPLAPTRVGLGPQLALHPERWPCLVAFPQKPTDMEEWEEREAMTLAVLADVRKRWKVDADRIALTGMSQGGHGVWTLAAHHPRHVVGARPGLRLRPRAHGGAAHRRRAGVGVPRIAGTTSCCRRNTQDIVAEILRLRTAAGIDTRTVKLTLYVGANHDAGTRPTPSRTFPAGCSRSGGRERDDEPEEDGDPRRRPGPHRGSTR